MSKEAKLLFDFPGHERVDVHCAMCCAAAETGAPSKHALS